MWKGSKEEKRREKTWNFLKNRTRLNTDKKKTKWEWAFYGMSDELKKNLNQDEKWVFTVGASRLYERVRNGLCVVHCWVFVRLYFVYFMRIHNIQTNKQKNPINLVLGLEIPMTGLASFFFSLSLCFLFQHCCRRCCFGLYVGHILISKPNKFRSKWASKHPHSHRHMLS